MKKKNKIAPAASKPHLLRQICNFIPEFLIPQLAGETGVDKKVRKFSAWSHVLSLFYAQLTHSIGLIAVAEGMDAEEIENERADGNERRDVILINGVAIDEAEFIHGGGRGFGGDAFETDDGCFAGTEFDDFVVGSSLLSVGEGAYGAKERMV